MHPILIPLIYGPAPRVPVTDAQRIGLMVAACAESKPTPSPRPCPLVRQWCATVTAWEIEGQREWARETGKPYKPEPVRLHPQTLLPM